MGNGRFNVAVSFDERRAVTSARIPSCDRP